MNNFPGIRSVFDAANALLRWVFGPSAPPDGNPHATLARGLHDKTGKIVACADKGTGLPTVLSLPIGGIVAGNLIAVDANGNAVDSAVNAAGSFSAPGGSTAGHLIAVGVGGVAEDSGLVTAKVLAAPGTLPVAIPFIATGTLTSASADTPVVLVAAANVPAGKKIYLSGFVAKVNGATPWATTTTVKLQDTNGTPVVFSTMAVAALSANAEVRPGSANVTSGSAYALGSGGTAANGITIAGDAAGTGSDLVVTAWGYIA